MKLKHILGFLAIGVALGVYFAWRAFSQQTERRFAAVNQRADDTEERIDGVERNLGSRLTSTEKRLNAIEEGKKDEA